MKKLSFLIIMLIGICLNYAWADKQSASTAILKAIDADKKVTKLGFAWRDTFKVYIGPAKKAFREGKYDKAEALANDAIHVSDLAMGQYKRSKNAGLKH
jgi:hypothetical protein